MAPIIPNRERPLRILVVDDQPVYRDLLQQVLVTGWHQVETAASGRAALTRLAAGAFDVVITDYTMAGMNGDRLAVRIKRLAPRTRVILLTGSDAGRRIAAGLVAASPAIDLVLAKPVLNGTLFHALTQVMDTLPPSEREDGDHAEEEILGFFQAAS